MYTLPDIDPSSQLSHYFFQDLDYKKQVCSISQIQPQVIKFDVAFQRMNIQQSGDNQSVV